MLKIFIKYPFDPENCGYSKKNSKKYITKIKRVSEYWKNIYFAPISNEFP